MFHVSISFTFTLDCLPRSSGSFIFRYGAIMMVWLWIKQKGLLELADNNLLNGFTKDLSQLRIVLLCLRFSWIIGWSWSIIWSQYETNFHVSHRFCFFKRIDITVLNFGLRIVQVALYYHHLKVAWAFSRISGIWSNFPIYIVILIGTCNLHVLIAEKLGKS